MPAPFWPAASQAVAPTAADPLALLGTLLLGWAFFAFTAHVAASYLLTTSPVRRAAIVGAPVAIASTLLVGVQPAVAVAAGLAVDAAAIHLVYETRVRTTLLMAALHYAISVALVLLVSTLLALFATAPA